MLVLFAACGFIGGVLVEKDQSTQLDASLGRGAPRGAHGRDRARARERRRRVRGPLRRASSAAAAAARTVGTVTNINGNKLYVTTTAGNTVEVLTTSRVEDDQVRIGRHERDPARRLGRRERDHGEQRDA